MGRDRMRTAARRCHGQASVEFALLASMLCAALLIPWSAGRSPAELLLGAVIASAQAFPRWLAVL